MPELCLICALICGHESDLVSFTFFLLSPGHVPILYQHICPVFTAYCRVYKVSGYYYMDPV